MIECLECHLVVIKVNVNKLAFQLLRANPFSLEVYRETKNKLFRFDLNVFH